MDYALRASSSPVKFSTKNPHPPGKVFGGSIIFVFVGRDDAEEERGVPMSEFMAGFGAPNGRSGREAGNEILRVGAPGRPFEVAV